MSGQNGTLTLVARRQNDARDGRFESIHQVVGWDPHRTAVIVCDMWDQHWCAGATRRVDELAPVMNEVVRAARQEGVLILHAPSETMEFYRETPQRQRAREAPPVSAPPPTERPKEPPLPIDDSDGGCDTGEPPWHRAWTRQHPALEIASADAISDSGDEVYNLFQQQGIENVILMGVHTNMCVLGRPFAIRRMLSLGKNVVLMRDMTDTMYNPAKPPFVSHFRGTDLVVEHIDRYLCPTITSTDFTGQPAFRFSEDRRPRVVCVIAEDEYHARETLPAFARTELEERLDFPCDYLVSDSKSDIPGLQELRSADLALFYLRRRTLPPEQMAEIRRYLESGKPLVALRTSSHGFQNWLEFDPEVLGGRYHGHTNNQGPENETRVRIAEGAAGHPILAGLPRDEFAVASSLYQVSPLAPTATPLLIGRAPGNEPPEPVAWVNRYRGARIFYTSLGHPDDFGREPFHRLLVNGILWALDRPMG